MCGLSTSKTNMEFGHYVGLNPKDRETSGLKEPGRRSDKPLDEETGPSRDYRRWSVLDSLSGVWVSQRHTSTHATRDVFP